MKTSLIQRAKIENRDNKKGLDSIISLDYMGYAEFEFGKLPKSLEKIRSSMNECTYLDVPVKDKVITVFCINSQKTEVKTYLEELAENKMRLKSYSDFDQSLNGGGRFDFWWDIENNLMFWIKNIEFEAKFKLIIAIKPEYN